MTYTIISSIIIGIILAAFVVGILVRRARDKMAAFDAGMNAIRRERAHRLAAESNHPAGRMLREKSLDRPGTNWN